MNIPDERIRLTYDGTETRAPATYFHLRGLDVTCAIVASGDQAAGWNGAISSLRTKCTVGIRCTAMPLQGTFSAVLEP